MHRLGVSICREPPKVSQVTLLAADASAIHTDFAAVLMFLLFGGAFVLTNMVVVGRLLRAKTKYTEAKSAPYECGEPTFGSAFVRFDIRFYVLALVFVIFDVEVLFLFPWAVVLKALGPLAYIEALVFVLVLALGLAYVWRKGDIDWVPLHGHKAPGARLAGDVVPAAHNSTAHNSTAHNSTAQATTPDPATAPMSSEV